MLSSISTHTYIHTYISRKAVAVIVCFCPVSNKSLFKNRNFSQYNVVISIGLQKEGTV